MGTITSARACHGIQAVAEPASEGTSGTLLIGQGQTVVDMTTATHAIVLGFEVDATNDIDLVVATMAGTLNGSGISQVETATAIGTITTAGNATVTVAGDDIPGSPLVVSVAVASSDTAATWAGKVRTALNEIEAITSIYSVGGAAAAITMTRIAARYNDPTLNIGLANGTCVGITENAVSTGTTAGANAPNLWRIAGNTYSGDDFEGIEFPVFTKCYGFHLIPTAGGGILSIADGAGALAELCRLGGAISSHDIAGLMSIDGATTLTIAALDGLYVKGRITLLLSE